MRLLIAYLTATRIKKALCALPLLLLLAAVWLNRRPSFYLDRFANPQSKQIEYRVCLVYHRWGTEIACPKTGSDIRQAEYELYVAEKMLGDAGLRQRWQWAP